MSFRGKLALRQAPPDSSTGGEVVDANGICGEMTGLSARDLFAEAKTAGYGEVTISRDRIVFRERAGEGGSAGDAYVRASKEDVGAASPAQVQVTVVRDGDGSGRGVFWPEIPKHSDDDGLPVDRVPATPPAKPVSGGVHARLAFLEDQARTSAEELQRAKRELELRLAEHELQIETALKLAASAAQGAGAGSLGSVANGVVSATSTLADGLAGGLTLAVTNLGSVANGFASAASATSTIAGGVVGGRETTRTSKYLHYGDKSQQVHDKDCLESVEIDESMWDVALLIGISTWNMGTTIYLMALLALNCCMQGGYIAILYMTDLTSVQYTEQDVEDFRYWRFNVAHDVQYYDRRTSNSLADRVCDSNKALHVSGNQARVYGLLSQYLGSHGLGMPVGSAMCVISIVAWLLTVNKETVASLAILRAVWSKPIAAETEIEVEDVDGELTYTVHKFSKGRKQFALFVCLARLAVSINMLLCGTFFLVYTIEISRLLLQTVVLGFVMNVDELVFASLAPMHVKKVIKQVAPFPIPKVPWWRAAFTSTMVFGMMMIAIFGILIPQNRTLIRAKDALCGGDTAFVFTVGGLGSPAWSYPDASGRASRLSVVDRNYSEIDFLTPFPNSKYNETFDYQTYVIDAVIQGNGRVECPVEGCYDTSAVGIPPPWENDRPKCCLAEQTKYPGTFKVEYHSSETVSQANDMYARPRSNLRSTSPRATPSPAAESGRILSSPRCCALHAGSWNPGCVDILDFPAYYRNLAAAAMGSVMLHDINYTACGGDDLDPPWAACPPETPFCTAQGECKYPRCADVAQYCDEDTVRGTRARQVCPHTCGCDQPQASLVLFLPESGCPKRCETTEIYKQALRSIPCEDMALGDPRFEQLALGWRAVAQEWPKDWKESSLENVKFLLQWGCSYLYQNEPPPEWGNRVWWPAAGPRNLGANPCVELGTFYPIPPLSYYCPVACGCRAGDKHCPDTCPRRNESEVEYTTLEPYSGIALLQDGAG